ncbi:hypothetical protein TEA_006352 [Camellia sinensis var. sinensis]|uniref:Uncharacterized protein n=1 Tax=Camellia sinensis var. sinensis TaxID=542762 RepID=A0A4S4DM58_CAMSN|nr:hypothetical protein TEA_006352 [Camellia sinensis var. sinensis]
MKRRFFLPGASSPKPRFRRFTIASPFHLASVSFNLENTLGSHTKAKHKHSAGQYMDLKRELLSSDWKLYAQSISHGRLLRNVGTMVPGIKTGRRKRATSGNVLSTSEACAQEIGTPMTFSDETQPPDDTQTVVEETQPGGDKFVVSDNFDNDEQAQQILDRKAYLLYKDWRYNLKQEFLELEEKGVYVPYSHPPSGVSLED